MLKNDLLIEGITILIVSMIFLMVGMVWNRGKGECWRMGKNARQRQEKCQFSDILTDSEFNTLLDETNYIE
ncbi:unnamed protein product (macronuclear) [Paramecium tetraurelia]|uniref:Uncharacterized protein n=1 Tax=Paramecium tetraurelia TaxID=5888 RepID=A0DMH1_PARTE|nr:uncharacterized protein GSPATT00018456001 [Paramecium tetraurelia]CAK84238.1 unnamed protein product [Paramecium tetraurelia]|eukprot:XP_001451635.1 hypothetical protein (macronuclear) [Paramecium tetraurelia strain d4-2]